MLVGAGMLGCGGESPPPPLDSATGEVGADVTPGETGADTGADAAADVQGQDTGTVDTGAVDTGPDAGVDTGVDTGTVDTGTIDTGTIDTGVDTGMVDTGVRMDTGMDSGVPDTGRPDTGVVDTGVDTGVDVRMPPPVESCPAPTDTITLPRATAYTAMRSTTGASRLSYASCTMTSLSGPEHVYTIQVASRTGVEFTTAGTEGMTDTLLQLQRTCGDVSTEIECNDDEIGFRHSRIATTLEPGTYSLIVGGLRSAISYRLSVRSYVGASNASCASATMLTSGVAVRGENTASGGAVSEACTVAAGEGGQLFYRLNIPRGQRAVVRVTPTSTGWRPVVRAIPACDSILCEGPVAAAAPGMPIELSFRNDRATETWIVSVSPYSAAAAGTYDIVATVGP